MCEFLNISQITVDEVLYSNSNLWFGPVSCSSVWASPSTGIPLFKHLKRKSRLRRVQSLEAIVWSDCDYCKAQMQHHCWAASVDPPQQSEETALTCGRVLHNHDEWQHSQPKVVCYWVWHWAQLNTSFVSQAIMSGYFPPCLILFTWTLSCLIYVYLAFVLQLFEDDIGIFYIRMHRDQPCF